MRRNGEGQTAWYDKERAEFVKEARVNVLTPEENAAQEAVVCLVKPEQ